MTSEEFLSAVYDSGTGSGCIFLAHENKRHTTFRKDAAALAAEAQRFNGVANVYFSCFTFSRHESGEKKGRLTRTAAQAATTRLFWLDLDVKKPEDPTRPGRYESQADAVLALRGFCKAVGLPKPTVASSGLGIHAYWFLDRMITRAVWQPVADRLKAACAKLKFLVDPSVISDAARIMRLPGTMNLNHPGHEAQAALLTPISYTSLDVIVEALAKVEVPEPAREPTLGFEAPTYTMHDEAVAGLLTEPQRQVSNFAKIIRERGCGQLTYIMEHQAEIPYPLWRAGLSIAVSCEDADPAIYDMSIDHPKYSQVETERVATGTTGPQFCKTFNDVNPGICEKCPHWGKISTPIVLGWGAAREPGAPTVIPRTDEPAVVATTAPTQGGAQWTAPTVVAQTTIPKYPFPYINGNNNEVLKQIKQEDGTVENAVIYDHPLYAVKRLFDPNERVESLWINVELPMDGNRQFVIPLDALTSSEKLRESCSRAGVVVADSKWKGLLSYLITWVLQLQKNESADNMFKQYGWTTEDTFVIGAREYRPTAVVTAPPLEEMKPYARIYTVKGDIETWRNITRIYDRPDQEARAFVIIASFAAPLMKFFHIPGCIISLFGTGTGTAKTATQMVAASVWGNPQLSLGSKDDTRNARMHRLARKNNLPHFDDEITNFDPKETHEYVYGVTNGVDKARMESQHNRERVAVGSWNTLDFTSSNESLVEKLLAYKDASQAAVMRVIEFHVRPDLENRCGDATEIIRPMYDNYGVAGELYAQYLVQHVESIRKTCEELRSGVEAKYHMDQKERIWAAVLAAMTHACAIIQELNLVAFDTERVMQWAKVNLLANKLRLDSQHNISTNPSTVVSQFIAENVDSTLVVNTIGEDTVVVRDVRYELNIRMEVDSNTIYINYRAFRKWLINNGSSVEDVIESLIAHGVDARRVTKRLFSGTGYVVASTPCVSIHDPQHIMFTQDAIKPKPKLTVVQKYA